MGVAVGFREDAETVAWAVIETHEDDPCGFVDARIDKARADGDDAAMRMWIEVRALVAAKLGARAQRTG